MRPPGFEPGSPAFFTTHLWEAEVLDQARPRPHVALCSYADGIVLLSFWLKVRLSLESEGKGYAFVSSKVGGNGGSSMLGSDGRLRRI